MFTIKDKEYIYIPMQYNMAWEGKRSKHKIELFEEEFLKTLTNYCTENLVYIWDFQNLNKARDRVFSEYFKKLTNRGKTIIMANIESNSALDKIMCVDIVQNRGKKILNSASKGYYVLGDIGERTFTVHTIRDIQIKYLNETIEKDCIETKYQYLVSSGVYSNMQINLKNLFYDTINFPYVIYLLWNQIYKEKFDAIIATSKNGVSFASILGEVLECDVLYFNIGQRFEETYNCSPAVKSGKKYVHVYDMICLGSETKVLNALVNSQGGEVISSVGCICLLDLDVIAQKNRYSSINHVKCLLGQKELKNEYKIFLKNPNSEE